ncbi:phosphoserine phosphatase SerB [Alcaligenaceae bacterium LF4-65]|jgi:phosphoserine phosphatase|uniref:Phosphoserine phosphatase n=1 Tax=Zwartia hollandica TaxID=324606 RepID=A0A953T2H1_9BURK|nr:phosphoserine phosphatase SerB [Zwartia hollandica]MBZ1351468.1 phosphoserine phosphatase SerB [Zwartia hollandica]
MTTYHLVVQSPALSTDLIEQAAAIAEASGVQRIGTTAARLLAVNDNTDTRAEILAWGERSLVDTAYVLAGSRLRDCKVLAMDMDSTLINIECIDEIAAFGGVKEQVASITEAAMRGEIKDFSESLTRRVAFLKDLSADVLQSVYEQKLRFNPGAEKLVATAKQAGLKVLLVSGGFTFFTEKLKARIGLDAAHANVLGAENGLLTGKVVGRILDAQGKADTLRAFAQDCGATANQIIAIGDGANDLKMLGLAGYSVAYRAKPVVRTQAKFALNVSGLDGVLNWFEA